jgi:ribosomal protein L11 methylase PrmA
MTRDASPASYKDPSGFIYESGNRLLRQVNFIYKDNYDFLMTSGLYDKLTKTNLMIPHRELTKPDASDAYKTLEPEMIPFITYPYEWCFGQLKDAALLTLKIQKNALEYGMSLKDATSFNIQFKDGKPVFIDTLSFERLEEGKPWVAYRQFCEQFLAPLALFAYTDCRLNGLLWTNLGSIPLDLATKLLPLRAKMKIPILIHILMHAWSQKKFTNENTKIKNGQSFNRNSLLAIVDNLENAINKLTWHPQKTIWTSYSEPGKSPSYESESLKEKAALVTKYLTLVKPKMVWDIGANTGVFSRIAAEQCIFTVSMDNDYSVIEQNYYNIKQRGLKNLLPLLIDLTNPTPALGFNNTERDSVLNRPHPDIILALALIHHLAIANNLPLLNIADMLAGLCRTLIIEFVPKTDKQVQLMLKNREDIFSGYNIKEFEKVFAIYFRIKNKNPIPDSERVLYLMEKK